VGSGPAPCIDALGHEVRPMAAKYVSPFCLKQKNSYNDARTIAEAVHGPPSVIVPISGLHRARAISTQVIECFTPALCGAQQVTPTMSQSRMWSCAAETAHLSAQHVLSQTLVIPRWRHVSPAIGRLARAIVLQCAP